MYRETVRGENKRAKKRHIGDSRQKGIRAKNLSFMGKVLIIERYRAEKGGA